MRKFLRNFKNVYSFFDFIVLNYKSNKSKNFLNLTREKMKKIFFSLFAVVLILAVNNVSNAQVDVTPSLATYANLKAAFTAVNAGTHGATPTVTITASYAEPDSAVLTNANIASCNVYTNGAFTITGNANSPIIILENADNVIIDGRVGQAGSTRALTITNSNSGVNNSIVCWRNGSSNTTVRYINAIGSTTAPTVGRLLQVAQTAAGGPGGCNNNTIENNLVDRGARGIQVFGTVNGANSFSIDNTIIRNNIVKNATAIGMFLGSNVKNITVEGNQIFFDAAVMTTQTSFTGMQIQACGDVNVLGNRVYGFSNSGAPNATYRGSIALPVSMTPLPDPVTTVSYVNNMISVESVNSTAGFAGACIQTQASAAVQFVSCTFNVYNNTLFFGGSSNAATAAASYGYLLNAVTPLSTQLYTLNYKNNIAKNSRSGGSTGAFHIASGYDSSSNVTVNADYNLYIANGTPANSWAAEFGSFVYPNGAIEVYKSNLCFSNDDQHTAFKNVTLTSATDLHIGGPVGGDLCGTPLATVTTDFDGAPRSATYPWKGADEGAAFKLLTLGAKLEGVTSASDVRVTLRSATCGIVSNCNADVNGTGVFCFGDSVANGTGYYLDVTSLNHLQTVSATTQSFTAGALSYNFRSAQTQSFGGNAVLDGGNWAFYGGDVTQDGTIDASDGALIDTDAFNFVFGCYLATDINGDGSVDATDANITDNNAFNFVGVATPCPGPTAPTVEPSQKVLNGNRPNVEVTAAQ